METNRLLFALSGVVLLCVLTAAAFQETRQEWKGYQVEYRDLAVKQAGSPKLKEAARRMTVEVRQTYLPKLGRVDRCTSCHLGVENPAMAKAPQPFRAHPGEFLQAHKLDRFGCTICHQGQGLATDATRAHGRVAHWERPMLRGDLMEATCGRCHYEETVAGAPVLSRGRELMGDLGCRGCHLIRGLGNNLGPELTGVATRDVNGDHKVNEKDWEWHFEHFSNPKSVNKTSFMPRFDLSKADIRALTVAMLALSDEEIHSSYRPLPKLQAPRRLPGAVERGRAVWRRFGCAGCHGQQGQGGIANANAQGGKVPSLTKYGPTVVDDKEAAGKLYQAIDAAYRKGVSLADNADEAFDGFRAVRKTIREGVVSSPANERLPNPPLSMPAWKETLTDQQISDLVAYIVSLCPDKVWDEDW